MRSHEYIEGFNSFKKNKGIYKNPYSIGTVKRCEFEAGWTQAIRKEPNSSFKNGKYIFSDISNSNDCKRKRIQIREYSKK